MLFSWHHEKVWNSHHVWTNLFCDLTTQDTYLRYFEVIASYSLQYSSSFSILKYCTLLYSICIRDYKGNMSCHPKWVAFLGTAPGGPARWYQRFACDKSHQKGAAMGENGNTDRLHEERLRSFFSPTRKCEVSLWKLCQANSKNTLSKVAVTQIATPASGCNYLTEETKAKHLCTSFHSHWWTEFGHWYLPDIPVQLASRVDPSKEGKCDGSSNANINLLPSW